MPSSGGEKLCPICDSPLQPGSKKCGFCGTDLSIFEMDFEAPKEPPKPAAATPPPAPEQRPSIESRMEEIFAKPPPEREAEKPAPPVGAPPAAPPRPEPVKEPEPVVAVEEAPKGIEYFECPECGTRMPSTAKSCPKCGVMFADEEAFECPACNTLVSIDAKSCPGCGALFVEPGEAGAAEAESAAPAKEDFEPPLAQVLAPPSKPAAEEVKPPPSKRERAEAAEAGAEEEEETAKKKKGLFGWFGREKKAPEAEVPEEKREVAGRAAPRPEPKAEEAPTRGMRPLREKPAAAPAPAPPTPAPVPSTVPTPSLKDKGKELARMVAEMKQLLALARDKEVEIGESKQLIDDAATAGREKDLDKAITLVQKSRTILIANVESHLADAISDLEREVKVARELGGEVSRPATYIQEAAKAKAAGDIEAAYVYAEKVKKELQPITGRYNDSKKKIESLKRLIADCESFFVDTKEARNLLVEATRSFEAKDFDRVDSQVKIAQDRLFKAIPDRMNEEIRRAKDQLLEAKIKNVNITPMITSLKAATRMLKSGDYAQALKEMRDFREMIKKA